MDINRYLERIRFSGEPVANFDTLCKLHLKHLLNIPFENLDIHIGRKIILDTQSIFRKIVNDNRGGFCYEMNNLFFEVLRSIGFTAKMVSARVYDSEEPGPEFDHMAIIVLMDKIECLADVGFGDSFMLPLKNVPGLIQKQNTKYYRIDLNDDGSYVVEYSNDGKDFNNMYRYTTAERKLEEFENMCNYHQTSPQSHFTQRMICTIARPDGRITLSGLKQIETKNGIKTETMLKDDAEFVEKLKELFGIELMKD